MNVEILNARWEALHKAGKVRWLPGMLDTTGRRYVEPTGFGGAVWTTPDGQGVEGLTVAGRIPSWRDPATLGCLLLANLGTEAIEVSLLMLWEKA